MKTFNEFLNESKENPLIKLRDAFIRKSSKLTGINESDLDALSECIEVQKDRLYVNFKNAPFSDGVNQSLNELFESLLKTDLAGQGVQYNYNQNSGWFVWT